MEKVKYLVERLYPSIKSSSKIAEFDYEADAKEYCRLRKIANGGEYRAIRFTYSEEEIFNTIEVITERK